MTLLLAVALGFTHCSSSSGGGGGGSKEPEPEPEPIGPAIYLWTTGCAVLGNMSGDGMDGACDNTTAYADGGADSICESRYTEDVASEHRTTIMEQHETGTLGHKAFLASSGGDSNLPQNFDINGKDSYPIRRLDGTQIAASWAALFNGAQDLDDSISGTEDYYWTGLTWSSDSGGFALADPPANPSTRNTNTCDDWGIASVSSMSIADYGLTGRGNEIGISRFQFAIFFCNSTSIGFASSDIYLLCITH